VTKLANGVAESSGLLISPDRLHRIAMGVAGRLSQLARLLGETPSIDAAWLERLYYMKKGQCGISGIPMTDPKDNHLFSIQLDHIVPIRKNMRLQKAVDGVGTITEGGGVACKNNVRWVCRAAHNVRHNIEHYGLDLTEFCQRVCSIVDNGCEIDPSLAYRMQFGSPLIDSARSAICEITRNGTRYASFEKVHAELHARGILISETKARSAMQAVVGRVKEFASRLRLEALRDRLQSDHEFRSFMLTADFEGQAFRVCSDYLCEQGIPPVNSKTLARDLRSLGLSLRRTKGYGRSLRTRQVVHGSIRSKLWDWAKSRGPSGFDRSEAGTALQIDDVELSMTLDDAVSRRLLDREGDRFFGRVTRREAANIINLAPDVLKKYAVLGKGPPYEMGRPGTASHTTYSFVALAAWRQVYPQRRFQTT
jgi:hypothetical protein